MSPPCKNDWERVKRIARYLKGRPRVVENFAWQQPVVAKSIFTDADWAGDKKTRKSTSGGSLMLGTHFIKGWARTQTLIALSSGESELYATFRAASEGRGLQPAAKDMGIEFTGKVGDDASGARGIIMRRGLGKTRRIDTGYVWIQHTAAEIILKLGKVLGHGNPVDLFAKHLDWDTIQRHCEKLSVEFTDGRASTRPKFHSLRAV